MRLNAVPENFFERMALRAGVVPTPLGDTIVAMTLARTIMVATKLGVFEALAKEESTAHEIAACCGLDQHAMEVLLFALAGAGATYAAKECAIYSRHWLRNGCSRAVHSRCRQHSNRTPKMSCVPYRDVSCNAKSLDGHI